MATSDSEFVKKALEGNIASFGTLVERYKNRVYNVACRILNNAEDAEDISQEAFVSAYKSLRQFDIQKKFGPWLFRITANLCIDFLRRRKYQSVSLDENGAYLDDDNTIQIPDKSPSPQKLTENAELKEIMEETIAELPPKYRITLMLRYIEDYTYSEIADALDTSVDTVKTHIHRGREILKKKLRLNLGEEWL